MKRTIILQVKSTYKNDYLKQFTHDNYSKQKIDFHNAMVEWQYILECLADENQ